VRVSRSASPCSSASARAFVTLTASTDGRRAGPDKAETKSLIGFKNVATATAAKVALNGHVMRTGHTLQLDFAKLSPEAEASFFRLDPPHQVLLISGGSRAMLQKLLAPHRPIWNYVHFG
jgi:hypothetical protein